MFINRTTVRFVDINTLIFYVQLLRIVIYIYTCLLLSNDYEIKWIYIDLSFNLKH